MHSAPSVTYPVGRSRFAGLLLSAIWLLGAAATALWIRQSVDTGWRPALALALVAAAGLSAFGTWWRSPAGDLAWEEGVWRWSGHPGSPVPGLDLQHVLLLRWRSQEAGGPARWLWLERSSRPGSWDAIRRAVYSRPNPEALPQAPTLAAKP